MENAVYQIDDLAEFGLSVLLAVAKERQVIMFANLKLQIFRRREHQKHLARALGIDETVVSKIIHGHRLPTPEQRKLISAYLQADEGWLFERFEADLSCFVSDGVGLTDKKKAGIDGDA